MRTRFLLVAVLISLIIFGCGEEQKESTDETPMPAGNHKVIVKEIEQANAYTYLLVDENGIDQWIAIAKNGGIEEGDVLYYKDALEMNDFESKDLERTFESVLFVQNISDKPIGHPGMDASSPHSNIKPEAKSNIDVEPAEGGITIGELFENAESYSGKTVKIRGQIVKVNMGIMNTNWYHIQDGSGDEENYDLTVTSNGTAKQGDVVTFEGKVTLDKDFGSGYKYDIIIEDAQIAGGTSS